MTSRHNLESPDSADATATKSWRRPLLLVGLLVVMLLLIGEQFPFSYFPMYSSFDPVADYYYVANTAGEPYACVTVFGTSTANVKKMYRARLRELVSARGAGENDATDNERHAVGVAMLKYLHELGDRSGAKVPSGPVVLERVVLKRAPDGHITQQKIIVAKD